MTTARCFAFAWVALVARIALGGAAAIAAEPLRVCLVSGALEYKSNESLADFQEFLERNYEARCSRVFQQGTDEEHLPGLEQLDECDVALLFTRRLRLSGDQLERIKKYCLSGKPLVGVRTASHAVQTWLELDKQVFGGDYQGHYSAGTTTLLDWSAADRKHPILAGFELFEAAGTLYKNPHIANDAVVLLSGSDSSDSAHVEPVAWTREAHGRVFYTSLGHPDDFKNGSFRRLLAQALFWTTSREVQRKNPT